MLWKNPYCRVFYRLSLPGLAWVVLVLAGCVSPHRTSFEPEQPPTTRPPARKIEPLIETPKLMREDYRQPRDGTRQKFYWEGEEAEWRIHFPASRYAHAGFRFYYPLNLRENFDRYALVFEMKPAAMAKYLWVGLVDGSEDERLVMVEYPLANDPGAQQGLEWGEFCIPLSAFGKEGERLSDDNPDGLRTEKTAFDWQDVQDIRFVVYGGKRPNRAIAIKHLRFDMTGKKKGLLK
ncbi:MAG: hypothetical protein H7A43_07225 [Verrucomicrobia bacterium]|nr:hypothetical protein [Verrucomicrobiota bacterium]